MLAKLIKSGPTRNMAQYPRFNIKRDKETWTQVYKLIAKAVEIIRDPYLSGANGTVTVFACKHHILVTCCFSRDGPHHRRKRRALTSLGIYCHLLFSQEYT